MVPDHLVLRVCSLWAWGAHWVSTWPMSGIGTARTRRQTDFPRERKLTSFTRPFEIGVTWFVHAQLRHCDAVRFRAQASNICSTNQKLRTLEREASESRKCRDSKLCYRRVGAHFAPLAFIAEPSLLNLTMSSTMTLRARSLFFFSCSSSCFLCYITESLCRLISWDLVIFGKKKLNVLFKLCPINFCSLLGCLFYWLVICVNLDFSWRKSYIESCYSQQTAFSKCTHYFDG